VAERRVAALDRVAAVVVVLAVAEAGVINRSTVVFLARFTNSRWRQVICGG
jgi:hypothetical protein